MRSEMPWCRLATSTRPTPARSILLVSFRLRRTVDGSHPCVSRLGAVTKPRSPSAARRFDLHLAQWRGVVSALYTVVRIPELTIREIAWDEPGPSARGGARVLSDRYRLESTA